MRNFQKARDTFIKAVALFVHKTFEFRIHVLAPPKAAIVPAGSAKGSVLTEETLLLVAENREGESLESLGKKRAAYCRRLASAIWLRKHLRVINEACRHSRMGSVHISLDAAGAGGKDATLGVLYHTGARAACWIPPQDRTPGQCSRTPFPLELPLQGPWNHWALGPLGLWIP